LAWITLLAHTVADGTSDSNTTAIMSVGNVLLRAQLAWMTLAVVTPLAMLAPQRLKEYPDLPTVGEQGVPPQHFEVWGGLVTPKGTPPAVVMKRHSGSGSEQNSCMRNGPFAWPRRDAPARRGEGAVDGLHRRAVPPRRRHDRRNQARWPPSENDGDGRLFGLVLRLAGAAADR
jgi:hypothetical protein